MCACVEMGLVGVTHASKTAYGATDPPLIVDDQADIGVYELCRKHGAWDATFYKWSTKYAGLEVSEVKQLRQLEDENRS